MNKPTRHLAVVVGLMFAVLMGFATYWQFFAAEDLANDARNTRSIYKARETERGSIIVAGKAIASSTPVDNNYKYKRVYTDSYMYSNITGYFSVTQNTKTGLENYANSILDGNDGALFTQNLAEFFTGEQQHRGGSIELTINPDVQKAAYTSLKGKKGAVVALEPSTGKILAQVSTPGFDANTLSTHDKKAAANTFATLDGDKENRPFYNRAIAGDQYAPGSVFKIVTTAAMLENNESMDENTMVDAPKSWRLPGTQTEMHNYGNSSCGDGSGSVTLQTAFIESCNTPFAIASTNVGAQKLKETAEKFGFGITIETPQPVTASRFPLPASDAETAKASIGQQDVRVTPMQMALVASTVANDGVMMQPHIIDKVYDSDMDITETTSESVLARPVSKKTASILQKMMIEDVKTGTGKAAAISGVQVAGKTGTAETGNKKAPNVWFVAYAPADEPRIALAVVLENGGEVGNEATGGKIAAPIARNIISALLK
ncbi:MAG: penicillin-binding protein 2 [Actinomycetaceae bacterium]|nr:penicillin-binding protein 2 [Actinomycetaceae bacterium]